MLDCLFLSLGLKINVHKNKLFGIGVFIGDIRDMVSVFCYRAYLFPLIYPCVSVGCNMTRIANWKGVFDKFKSKLSSWKDRTLSIGGRLTLIKAVLGNLPAYYMSLYRMAVVVEKTLESMPNKFSIVGDCWIRCLST